MVLVDSSIWLIALDSSHPNTFQTRVQMEALLGAYLVSITETVRFDLLRKIPLSKRSEFLSYLNQIPVVIPKKSTWNVAVQIAWDLKLQEIEIESSEALIAALSLQLQEPLFTRNPIHKIVAECRQLTLLS